MSKILIDEATVKQALEALEGALSDDKPYIENSKKAITALREALAQQPAQPYKGIADHTNQVTNGRMRIDPVTGDVGIGTPFSQPAQQEPVAWPAGLIERIKAAEQRIQDGHAPRRIPADPTDVDLVLAEVRYLLEGKQPPFWVHTSPPAQRKPLTDEQKEKVWGDHFDGSTDFNSFCSIAEHVEAAHNIKQNT